MALTPYVEGEWLHSEQGVRVLTVLEPLNLTWEVLDGVRAHTWKVEPPPSTPEGWLCRYADRIAYLVHDFQDAVRAGLLAEDALPREIRDVLGDDPGSPWVKRMIHAVIDESIERGRVVMEPEVEQAMHAFRKFMFANVYLREEANRQAAKAVKILRDLVDYFLEHPDEMPETYRLRELPLLEQVLDVVAGMTDRYALRLHDEIFRPKSLL